MVTIDEIVKSKRKTLAVTVNALGKVTVRAPLRASQKEIENFVKKHEDWILRKKENALASCICLPTQRFNGYKLLLLGKYYEIVLYQQERVALDHENCKLYLPEKNAEQRLVGWIKENALRILIKSVEEISARMGVKANSVSITGAKSFWGICTAKNDLRFCYRILYAPRDVLEYVVVHELAHIKHKNHSPLFWGEVAKYIPNWKEKRRWLKERVLLIQIF